MVSTIPNWYGEHQIRMAQALDYFVYEYFKRSLYCKKDDYVIEIMLHVIFKLDGEGEELQLLLSQATQGFANCLLNQMMQSHRQFLHGKGDENPYLR